MLRSRSITFAVGLTSLWALRAWAEGWAQQCVCDVPPAMKAPDPFFLPAVPQAGAVIAHPSGDTGWTGFVLPDGRQLFLSGADETLELRDPVSKSVTRLGYDGALRPIPGRGMLIQSKYESSSFFDIDPDRSRPQLRRTQMPLKKIERSPDLFELVGQVDGALVVSARPARPTPDAPPTLWCLAGVTTVLQANVAPRLLHGLTPAGPDSIRGHVLLATGPWRAAPAELRSTKGQQCDVPVAEVFAVDLRTGEKELVGEAVGNCTQNTATGHPYLQVGWSDQGFISTTGQEVAFVSMVDVVTRLAVTVSPSGLPLSRGWVELATPPPPRRR